MPVASTEATSEQVHVSGLNGTANAAPRTMPRMPIYKMPVNMP